MDSGVTAVPAVMRYSSSNEQSNFLDVEDSVSQGQAQLFYQSWRSNRWLNFSKTEAQLCALAAHLSTSTA